MNLGTIDAIAPDTTVVEDGATVGMKVSYVIGGTVAVNDRVLWAQVGREIVVFVFVDVR